MCFDDNILLKILKLVVVSKTNPLDMTNIYYLNIKRLIFPGKLKFTLIKPRYKNRDKTNINNIDYI